MRSKKNIIVAIIVVVALVGLIIGSLSIYNYINKKNNTNNNTNAQTEQVNTTDKTASNKKRSSKRAKGSSSDLEQVETNSVTKEKRKLENYNIIGTIEIPKTELKCDILSEVTKRSIEIAVGQMYSTSSLNKPGNTVIYGHNYRNTLFFSRNDELVIGDKIYITDEEEGKKLTYEIYDIFETTSTDTTFYTRTAEMTGGKAEITLSTCTDDASTTDRRLIILAREV